MELRWYKASVPTKRCILITSPKTECNLADIAVEGEFGLAVGLLGFHGFISFHTQTVFAVLGVDKFNLLWLIHKAKVTANQTRMSSSAEA